MRIARFISVVSAVTSIVVVASLPARAGAQQPDSTATIVGRIIDATDSGAVAHARVEVLGGSVVTSSDGWGFFRLSGIRPGQHEIVIRAIGYAKLRQTESLRPGEQLKADFTMMRIPHVLTQMVVQGRSMRVPRGMEDIYRRGAKGFGRFFTHEQIDSLNPMDLKTVLAWIPGVHPYADTLYFAACNKPHIWVDGQDMTRLEGRNAELDFLQVMVPSEVQAMEVYTHHIDVPAEFLSGDPCGVVAIWTRRGP